MQIVFETSILASDIGVQAFGDGIASFFVNGETRLIYDVMPNGNVGLLTLSPSAPVTEFEFEADGDFAVVDTGQGIQIYSFTGPGSYLRSTTIDATGALSESRIVTQNDQAMVHVMEMSSYHVTAGNFVVTVQWRQTGFSRYEVDPNGNLIFAGSVADTRKSYVANVSDTLPVTLAGQTYLLTTSAGENGLTVFRTLADGSLEFHDSLGMNEDLPVNGLAAITMVDAWGATFAVLGATLTSSVSTVRINDMGVLFMGDHMIDDIFTKFRSIAALDTFSHNGRTFVVAAGNDAGISILEMLPGGELTTATTFISDAYSPLGTVTGIEANVIGDQLQIHILQATRTQIMEFTVDLSNLAAPIFVSDDGQTGGTVGDDLIFGGDGDNILSGGRGEDIIIDGDGLDELRGSASADTFVLVDDDYQDIIADFQPHLDRIDLSNWGRLYSHEELTFIPIAGGIEIRFEDEALTVYTMVGKTLTADDMDPWHFTF